MTTTIKLEDGKYTVTHDDGTNLRALRHGEPWRDLVGDGLVLAMAQRIEQLEAAQSKVGESFEIDGQKFTVTPDDPEIAKTIAKVNARKAYTAINGGPDYERDVKPAALALLAKKGPSALVAICDEFGVSFKDANPEQWPDMLDAIEKAGAT